MDLRNIADAMNRYNATPQAQHQLRTMSGYNDDMMKEAQAQDEQILKQQAAQDELRKQSELESVLGNMDMGEGFNPNVFKELAKRNPQLAFKYQENAQSYEAEMARAARPKLSFNPVTGEMFDMRSGTPWGGDSGAGGGDMGGGGAPYTGGASPPPEEEEPEAFRMVAPPAGLTPKDRAAWNKKESARVLKTRESAPVVTQNLKQTAGLIDQMLSHPGFEGAVGAKDASSLFGVMGEPFAGTEAAGFNSIFKQVQGKQFLAAFQELKGAGAITEKEGQKATEAYSRLSLATKEEEFKKAAAELKDVLSSGYQRLTGKSLSSAGLEDMGDDELLQLYEQMKGGK